MFLRKKSNRNSSSFIPVFNNLNGNHEFQDRGKGIGVLLRAPDYTYAGHNRDVYRVYKYYLDGNTDRDNFLNNLDK